MSCLQGGSPMVRACSCGCRRCLPPPPPAASRLVDAADASPCSPAGAGSAYGIGTMEELEGAVRSLSLERDLSGIMDSPLGRRGARRSLRSEPFFIGVAGGTASGEAGEQACGAMHG